MPALVEADDVGDLVRGVDPEDGMPVTVDALALRDPARSTSLLTDTQWKRGVRLTDVLMFAGPAVLADIERALDGLNRNRGLPA